MNEFVQTSSARWSDWCAGVLRREEPAVTAAVKQASIRDSRRAMPSSAASGAAVGSVSVVGGASAGSIVPHAMMGVPFAPVAPMLKPSSSGPCTRNWHAPKGCRRD